jgi:hypothetical protein
MSEPFRPFPEIPVSPPWERHRGDVTARSEADVDPAGAHARAIAQLAEAAREQQQREQAEQQRRDGAPLRFRIERQGGDFVVVVQGGNLLEALRRARAAANERYRELRACAEEEAAASPEVAMAATRQEQLGQAQRLLAEAQAAAAKAKADVARAVKDGAHPAPAEARVQQAVADERTLQARIDMIRPLAEVAAKEATATRQRAKYLASQALWREQAQAREAVHAALREQLSAWLLAALAVLDVQEQQ